MEIETMLPTRRLSSIATDVVCFVTTVEADDQFSLNVAIQDVQSVVSRRHQSIQFSSVLASLRRCHCSFVL